jgi:iron(III) transport system ATP-binding protein
VTELGAVQPDTVQPDPVQPDTVQPAALSVTDVRREIDGRAIVHDASFDVAEGELFVLVGPSGCGKSTLLRVVAGLDPAERGSVLLSDRDVTKEPPERRRIGLVFQDHALFPHRRIDQNIAFGITHLDRRERNRRVGELLELVRLDGMAKRYPHELSGGEQQRIALARALAPEPAVVLLDEPFASLDPSLRDDVRSDVVGALRARGAAAVLVTHDRHEALALGDRIAVMSEGRILQIGRPDEVYERPINRFVAKFLGDASFLSDANGTVLMARPHDLELLPSGDDVVIDRKYLGAVWHYLVRRPDGTTVNVEQASNPASPAVSIGARCSVALSARHALHRLPAG